jgi:hypothetical protein
MGIFSSRRLPSKDELLARLRNRQGFSNVANGLYWTRDGVQQGRMIGAWLISTSGNTPMAADKASNARIWPVRDLMR